MHLRVNIIEGIALNKSEINDANPRAMTEFGSLAQRR